MFNIDDKSVFFLEYHLKNSFKEIMNDFVINNVEWLEGEEVRAYANLRGSNVIALFPPFRETDDYYLPENNS